MKPTIEKSLKYYVYAYIRSKDSKTAKAGTPYYIGKGTRKRAYVRHSISKPNDSSKIIICESNLSEIGAYAIERKLISFWGRKIDNSGILHNKTLGGPGLDGYILNTEQKTKISVKNKNRIFSDSHRKKLSEAAKISSKLRPPMSDQTKSKISAASSQIIRKSGIDNPLFGIKRPDHGEFMKKHLKDNPRIISAETKKKISDCQRGKLASSETKNKMKTTRRNKGNSLICLDIHKIFENKHDALNFILETKQLKSKNHKYNLGVLSKSVKNIGEISEAFGYRWLCISREDYLEANSLESIMHILTSFNLDNGTGY